MRLTCSTISVSCQFMPDGHLFISAICIDQENEHFLSIHIINMFSVILSFYVFTLYFAKSESCFDLKSPC